MREIRNAANKASFQQLTARQHNTAIPTEQECYSRQFVATVYNTARGAILTLLLADCHPKEGPRSLAVKQTQKASMESAYVQC